MRWLEKSSAGINSLTYIYTHGGRYPAAAGAAKYLLKAFASVIGFSIN
jgi:hypothetical protein